MLGARLTEATSTDPSVSGAALIKATHALRALTPARTDLGSSTTPFTDADPHAGSDACAPCRHPGAFRVA